MVLIVSNPLPYGPFGRVGGHPPPRLSVAGVLPPGYQGVASGLPRRCLPATKALPPGYQGVASGLPCRRPGGGCPASVANSDILCFLFAARRYSNTTSTLILRQGTGYILTVASMAGSAASWKVTYTVFSYLGRIVFAA